MSSHFCVAAGITVMAWSLEEKLLLVGTQEGMVAVWDMEEQQVVHILPGHTGEAWKMGLTIRLLLESYIDQSVARVHLPPTHFSVSKLWSLFLHQLATAV